MEYFYMGITIIVVFLMVALIGAIELIKEELESLNEYIVHLISRNTGNIDKDLRDIDDRLKEISKKMHI